ncbi:MAG: alpha-2-macroglobulin family protein, partial [Chitinophagaceae bacterium]
ASTFVSIGYHALVLGLSMPADKILQNDKTQSIGITASNLSGVPLTVQAHMSVYPLNSPQRLIRQRYWNAPDSFVMTEKEYLQSFPFDEYANETKKENWQKGKAVFEKTDSIKGNQFKLDIPTKTLAPGWYIMEAKAKDSYGQAVNAIEYFQVMDSKSGVVDRYGYFSSRFTKSVVQPGDTTKQQINTSADALWIIQLTDGYKSPADKKTPTGKISRPMDAIAYEDPGHSYRFYNLNKESKEFSYTVSEEERGGFGVSHAFVKHNRFFSTNDIISVPWKNKELDISFTTFRDKTLPGSREEWTVNIKGKKGDKVAAEILTSMYDASLDQFRHHQWQKPTIYENYPTRDGAYLLVPWTAPNSFRSIVSQNWRYPETDIKMYVNNYDALLWESHYNLIERSDSRRELSMAAAPMADSSRQMLQGKAAGVAIKDEDSELNEVVVAGYVPTDNESNTPDTAAVQIRKNFNETAFFFPQLKTDAEGNVKFTFTMPEAMTQWKWQVLAHTKDLSFGFATKSIITQKELMVQPNAPRFLREGDQLVFPARISNLTDKEISGQAQLQVIDAGSGQVVDGLFSNIFPTQYFTVAANQGTLVNFNLTIPGNYSKPVIYRIIAKAGEHSDGEEKALPILSNRILLTESMPIQLRGTGSKSFVFDKLLQSASSPSLTHHKLTIEYSSNPAWYAVQSLPYLTNYPHDCAEQVFNRFYANAMAAKIVASTPKIKAYYEQWLKDSANGKSVALLSNLSKNPELKSILLEETPWVLEAKNETEQKRNIAVLFDLTRLSRDMDAAIAKLQQAQSPNGGFVWFSGGPDDRYITQYIITGLGKLKKAGAIPEAYKKTTDRISNSGLGYLHKRIKEDYDNLLKIKANLNNQQISSLQIQYLYALSFHLDQSIEGAYLKAMTYYHKQAQQYWQKQSPQLQAMTALVLFRSKDGSTSKAIINSLRERSIKNETLGMYLKNNQPAYFWQDAPIETQALLIEAFSEVSQDEAAVSSMKQWLLTQKQTNSWSSTKATADACYALLMKGSNWLDADRITTIKVGTTKPLIFSSEKDSEAG